VSNEIVIRITVPDGLVPVVDYSSSSDRPAAPPSSGAAVPSCPQHGPMTHKAGTNKAGKPYSGFFCFADGCETTPVWDPKR
jgi:hypothetical protein